MRVENEGMKVAIYARVSTKDQHCEMQLAELRGLARRSKWTWFEYVEQASGKEGSKRPVLAALLKDARQRRFEAVVVWKMDRFGRSIKDFIGNVRELTAVHVRLMVPSQGIDTADSSPMGTFTLHLFALLAELERDLIWERTTLGQANYMRAHAAGEIGKRRHSKSGRDLPVGRPRRIFDRPRAIALRRAGKSIREVPGALGIGRGTVERLLGEAAAMSAAAGKRKRKRG